MVGDFVVLPADVISASMPPEELDVFAAMASVVVGAGRLLIK
jgi:hypothetical protein